MEILNNLKIKIFADGADEKEIIKLNEKDYIKGFTTNPSLMKKANIKNYETFARDLLGKINTKPISFEVFSDDLNLMEKQAEKIATWGKNVNVKIPITNTKSVSTCEIIRRLSTKGIICNITAIFTLDQLKRVVDVLHKDTPAILSVFAGKKRTLRTVTVVIGVKGTGVYLVDDSKKTYICTSYGTSHLQVKDALEISESVTTSHHDQPRFIYFGEKRIEQAPVINHSDQELILLEKLVTALLLS